MFVTLLSSYCGFMPVFHNAFFIQIWKFNYIDFRFENIKNNHQKHGLFNVHYLANHKSYEFADLRITKSCINSLNAKVAVINEVLHLRWNKRHLRFLLQAAFLCETGLVITYVNL